MPLNEGNSVSNCFDCKKEIFATHQRFYLASSPAIPNDYAAYWIKDTLEQHLGAGVDTTNAFIFAMMGYLNGNINIEIGNDLQVPFDSALAGLPISDLALVQAMTDLAMPALGLSVGDYIYTITNDNQPIWFLSPAAVAALSGGTFLQIYINSIDTPGNYNKYDVTFIPPYTSADVNETTYMSNSSCKPIQEIKEKDTCTGEESYRYIIENGSGLLVSAASVLPNFDETNVVISCPELILLEREVCGTINGSAVTYELIKVYSRDKATGESSLLFYEDKKGNKISGTVVETCCTCDSICDVLPSTLDRICFAYKGSFNGSAGYIASGEKYLTGADMFIEYFEVNGTPIVTSQTFIGNSGVATFSDVGYGLAFDSIVNLLNSSIISSTDLEFVPAGNASADTGWGVKYNSASTYKLVLSDFLPISSGQAFWTICINPTEQFEGLGNGTGFWTSVDYQANVAPIQFLMGCQSL